MIKYYIIIYNCHDSAIVKAIIFRNLSMQTCNICSAIEYLKYKINNVINSYF